MVLEDRSHKRAVASFPPLVRRTHIVFGDALVALREGAMARDVFSEEGAEEVVQAGVVVRG